MADQIAKGERQRHRHGGQEKEVRIKSSPFKQELTADPSGIGFAFGGVEPGILHAHGQLHEVHKVFFSVGRVGKYLLHVALRKQALPLPGSPFTLEVVPGPAHSHSTKLDEIAGGMLRGTVGTAAGDGCNLTFFASDKMGNICREGGAVVAAAYQHDGDRLVECKTEDKGDGSYNLQWRSKYSGTFEIHVLVDGSHVQGSPLKMRLISTIPELAKTIVNVPSNMKITAGVQSTVTLTFQDQFDNSATPGPEHEFAMALLPEKSGEKVQTTKPFEHTGKWAPDESGEYSMIFTPTQAGITDLHVWCATGPSEKQERTPLPGSPFQVLVNSGKPNAAVSEVDGYGIESLQKTKEDSKKGPQRGLNMQAAGDINEGKIVAGDAVFVRPTLADVYGNPANVPDGALIIALEGPDGEETLLEYQAHVRGGLTSYEIRHDTKKSGLHSMHVRLHGLPIKGSPVQYEIAPATHEASLSIVESDKLPPTLFADAEPKYSFYVRLRDRFYNLVDTGGATCAARLLYVKQGMHDSNALNAHNHFCTQEDKGDGSYLVTFGLLSRGLNFAQPLTVNVIINLDRDPKEKPNGIDLPAVVCTFVLPPEAAHAAKEEKAAKEGGGKKPALERSRTSAVLKHEGAPAPAAAAARKISKDSEADVEPASRPGTAEE